MESNNVNFSSNNTPPRLVIGFKVDKKAEDDIFILKGKPTDLIPCSPLNNIVVISLDASCSSSLRVAKKPCGIPPNLTNVLQ